MNDWIRAAARPVFLGWSRIADVDSFEIFHREAGDQIKDAVEAARGEDV